MLQPEIKTIDMYDKAGSRLWVIAANIQIVSLPKDFFLLIAQILPL